MNWTPGLNAATSVGGFGRYRELVSDDGVRLPTCVWDHGRFRRPGTGGKGLFDFDLPAAYSVQTTDVGWTGKTVGYCWDGGGFELDLRTTLPGPRIVLAGTVLPLRWSGNPPDAITSLEDHADLPLSGAKGFGRSRMVKVTGRHTDTLIVLSEPIKALNVYSHGHWQLEFGSPGASLLVVPLLNNKDLPATDADLAIWQSLLRHPPRLCDELYAIESDVLQIEQRFAGAQWSPLPSFWTQASDMRGLLRLPAGRKRLLHGLTGPYELVSGDRWRAEIGLAWTHASARPAKIAGGVLQPIPDELAYAGDWTWQPGTPMDQLLSLRTWAPLLGAMPQDLRERMILQLAPPTAGALAKSLHTIREPHSGIEWAKEIALFDHKGDISWDPDWYNGFTLSGIDRAVRSGEPRIAEPARRLAAESRPQRALLLNYFQVFHDWDLAAAWTDARGTFMLPDCGHNGLEGILGEARLRRDENDPSGADFALYLAGKTAATLIAMIDLPDWSATSGFVIGREHVSSFLTPGEPGARTFGANALVKLDGIATIVADTRNPYTLAGHFPQYAALLRDHAPPGLLREMATAWEQTVPRRYADWVGFYLGDDAAEIRRKFTDQLDQEMRVQAAVFYHLAPEVCFRAWVLQEPPDSIEQRFSTPLNLAEQLLLRSDMRLTDTRPSKETP